MGYHIVSPTIFGYDDQKNEQLNCVKSLFFMYQIIMCHSCLGKTIDNHRQVSKMPIDDSETSFSAGKRYHFLFFK